MEKSKLVSMWLEMRFKKLGDPLKIKLEAPSLDSMAKTMNEVEGAVKKGDWSKLGGFFDLIVDWDAEVKGKKIPCDEANKNKYLPPLLDLCGVDFVRPVSLDAGDPELSDQIMTALGWKESIH